MEFLAAGRRTVKSASRSAELNPDEGVWRQTKQRLANHCPTDRYKLALAVIAELKALRRSPSRLWACIKHTGLVLDVLHVLHDLCSAQ